MGRWTRRAFLAAGLVAGGGLIVGVAIRPGPRARGLAKFVEGEGETLVHTWVKLDQDNTVTALIPHAEMGQGVGTALSQMLADELDADWDLVRFEHAPAISEFANAPLGKGMLLGGVDIPDDRRRAHSHGRGPRHAHHRRQPERARHRRVRHANRRGRREGNAARGRRRSLAGSRR